MLQKLQSVILGNGVVLIVIGSTKQLHTTSNFYISSMAASDLLFLLICAPLNIYQLHAFQCWQLGPVACSLTFYMMNVSIKYTEQSCVFGYTSSMTTLCSSMIHDTCMIHGMPCRKPFHDCCKVSVNRRSTKNNFP